MRVETKSSPEPSRPEVPPRRPAAESPVADLVSRDSLPRHTSSPDHDLWSPGGTCGTLQCPACDPQLSMSRPGPPLISRAVPASGRPIRTSDIIAKRTHMPLSGRTHAPTCGRVRRRDSRAGVAREWLEESPHPTYPRPDARPILKVPAGIAMTARLSVRGAPPPMAHLRRGKPYGRGVGRNYAHIGSMGRAAAQPGSPRSRRDVLMSGGPRNTRVRDVVPRD